MHEFIIDRLKVKKTGAEQVLARVFAVSFVYNLIIEHVKSTSGLNVSDPQPKPQSAFARLSCAV